MKKYLISSVPLILEILAFIVTNDALQWILAIAGLFTALIVFKTYMPKAYYGIKETVYNVFLLYKWDNLKQLLTNSSEGMASRLSFLLLLICLFLCVFITIVYAIYCIFLR